jgi:UDP-N-acetylmuramyl pentapeptide synthase
VFTVGEFSKITHDNLKSDIEKKHYATRNELLNDLKNILQNKDVVLVKGSNSIGLDKVIEKLYK